MRIVEKNKLAIFMFSILGVLATDSFAPLINRVSASYPDVPESIVKQLITLPSMISMLVGLIVGQLVRFIKKRLLILVGLFLFGICSLGAFWMPSFGFHIMLRAMLGIGIGLVNTINLSLIGDFFKGAQRAKMIGNSLAFSKIFAITVPPIAAMAAVNNWRNVYYLYTISLVIFIFAIFALDAPFKDADIDEPNKRRSKIPAQTFLLATAQFILLAVFFVLVTDLPYLLDENVTNSTLISGFGLSTTTIGTTIAGLYFNKLFSKVRNWIIPLGLIITGVGFIVVTHSPSTIPIILGLLLSGFGIGILISTINLTTINSVGDSDSTAALSLITCASSLGVFISPLLFRVNPINFQNLSSVESDFQSAGLLYLFLGVISLVVIVILKIQKQTQMNI